MNGLGSFEQINPAGGPLSNSNAILNRRKQYRNVPAGNKLEQLSHPSHPMHHINSQNFKQVGQSSNQIQIARTSFMLN
jgi:hypothetical protein